MSRLRTIGRLRAGGSGAASDADAIAWAAAVVANGGTVSAGTLAAVTTFTIAAKASGYWTKLNRINLFCGDQLAAATVPLKAGGGSATDTNVNFVGGDYAEATGLTGNGTTKYLNTGLVASSLTTNDTHLAIYNRSSTAAAGGLQIGASSGAATTIYMMAPFTDGNANSDQYTNSTATGRAAGGVIAGPFGFIVGSRTTSTAHSIYRNGASIGSNTNASTGVIPALAIYVCAQNGSGSAANFTSQPLAAYSIGSGLTAGEVTAYNTHMQAFQTALGRNV